ncbi:class I adenylate-forming enzyme family protein [Lysinibacillus sp. NPDC048646]|uniref:class I adenylate-forming enzyme family protein n=1 Tax=Lysinibacillus sp. NPDC048646 TaxID=3390574 RepID=UPI003D03C3F0
MNLTTPLMLHAHRTPQKVCLVYQEKEYTYQSLNEEVNCYANGLIAHGIKKGDKIAVFMKNSDDFIIAAYAVWKVGAVLVPINFRLTATELSYILGQSDSVLVLADAELEDVCKEACASLALSITIAITPETFTEGLLSFRELRTNNIDEPGVTIAPLDDAEILYTSGTTGKPKGALFDHNTILNVNVAYNQIARLEEEDCYLLVAPIFHSAGMNLIFLTTMLTGGTLVVQRDFHPVEALKAIEKHKVTAFFGVSAMYNAILQVPEKSFDLSSIRFCAYGAAPMSPTLVEQSMAYFGTNQFYNYCGLTEAGPGGIFLSPEQHKTKLGAGGKSMPLTNARVVNEQMVDVVPGEIGELTLRGATLMKEYYKKPEDTKKTFVNGWLLTGDLATIDEEGFITVVDRKKDMIISGGENVYSIEVEQVINGHPQVLEAATIGVPDEQWGEVVAAVIVAKPGETVNEGELQQYCRKSLAGYKVPRKFFYVETLPRNASGKILKYHLRETIQ